MEPIVCPECDESFRLRSAPAIGQTVRCRHCGAWLYVVAQSPLTVVPSGDVDEEGDSDDEEFGLHPIDDDDDDEEDEDEGYDDDDEADDY